MIMLFLSPWPNFLLLRMRIDCFYVFRGISCVNNCVNMNPCKSCGIITKYQCILCGQTVCLRPECSIPEVYEEAPGWVEFKSVGYCLKCKGVGADSHTPTISCSSSPKARNESDSDIEVTETSENSHHNESDNEGVVEKGKTKRKSGRKSFWQETHITDMVDIIINDEELVRKLIFTNTKKSQNTDAYQKVLPQLNNKYKETTGKDFPFTVQQMRTKFKWCISICKKICLTIKTASGVKNFIEDKGYGNWFNLLYPLVKTRDACQPEKAFEPSAHGNLSGTGSSSTCDDGDGHESCSVNPLEDKGIPDKTMFVPVKKAAKRSHKDEAFSKSLELLQATIENDPTKELLQILREDMKHSREEEMRYFQLMCGLMSSNQNLHVPVPPQQHGQVFPFPTQNGNRQYDNQSGSQQPSNIPFTQHHVSGHSVYSPMTFQNQSTNPANLQYQELRPATPGGEFQYVGTGTRSFLNSDFNNEDSFGI